MRRRLKIPYRIFGRKLVQVMMSTESMNVGLNKRRKERVCTEIVILQRKTNRPRCYNDVVAEGA